MITFIKYIIIVALASSAGWYAREHVTPDRVTRAVHTIENTAKAVHTNHVALERDLARRERRDEEMFALFDRVLTIIENDVEQRKVAIDTPRADNKEQ
jgi:hypothetical protein